MILLNQIKSRFKTKKLADATPTAVSRGNFEYYVDSPIHTIEEGNIKVKELLQGGNPCMITRFGSTELSAVYQYYLEGSKMNMQWSALHKQGLNKDSGFFPSTDEMISKFCSTFIEHVKNTDLLGVWFREGEETMVTKFLPNAYLTPLRGLEPYYFQNPWSSILENKKVLVIHPFAKSIQKQYLLREKLFVNNILPAFSLETIEAVQSLGTTKTRFASWFDAYESMCNVIQSKDFDIAIIGAGAYGLPLASFVKSQGKKAVHLGGATQLLFGIKGKRWDNHIIISKLYNEYWVRPSESETPARENLLEDGCYW